MSVDLSSVSYEDLHDELRRREAVMVAEYWERIAPFTAMHQNQLALERYERELEEKWS